MFLIHNIIEPVSNPCYVELERMQYRTTDKGKAFMEMLLQTPFPKVEVQTKTVYLDPRTKEAIKTQSIDEQITVAAAIFEENLKTRVTDPTGSKGYTIGPGFYRRVTKSENWKLGRRFKITWRDGSYYVNIPNYQGGEVVEVV